MSAEQTPHSAPDALGRLGAYLTSLAESHGQDDVVRALCEAAARELPESQGAVWQLALNREGWHLSGGWHQGRTLPAESGPPRHRPESLAADELQLPLVAQGLAVGQVHATGTDLQQAEGQQMLQALATAAAISLSGHLLQRRVRHRNVRDPLTGLFNRRYLEDTLERELHRARRSGSSLVLIRLEIDRIEAFAEAYGPETADRLLQTMADAVHRSFRGSDVCCRAGDHGFGILLPDASLEDGTMRGEAVREELSEIRVPQGSRALEPLSVSAGVAAYPNHSSNRDLLLEAAESALLRAHDEGGDILRVAEQVAAPPEPHQPNTE
ncbi:MAG: GGDEF domain-containing protein [Halorhodospira sp.]